MPQLQRIFTPQEKALAGAAAGAGIGALAGGVPGAIIGGFIGLIFPALLETANRERRNR
jgi:hypothetical protein